MSYQLRLLNCSDAPWRVTDRVSGDCVSNHSGPLYVLATPVPRSLHSVSLSFLRCFSGIRASPAGARLNLQVQVGGCNAAAGNGRRFTAMLERNGSLGLQMQKHRYDSVKSIVVLSAAISDRPTLLDRQAKALQGATNFSWHERTEAMNGLLDLLEQKGVRSGYAFEFVRHAGDLVDILIVEAKESFFDNYFATPPFALRNAHFATHLWDAGRTYIEPGEASEKQEDARLEGFEPLLDMRRLIDIDSRPIRQQADDTGKPFVSLALRVVVVAEKLGIARLALYFQFVGMKAHDIPKLLPFVSRNIDMVIAKGEFLRVIGVQVTHLPGILIRWPQLLTYPCESLVSVADYLRSLGLSNKEIGKIVTRSPQILGRQVQDLVSTLMFLENLGIPRANLRKLIVRYPSLLTDDAVLRVESLRKFFEGIGVKQKHIAGLLVRRPMLLESSIEKDLLPIVDYLKSINANADDIDKIVTSFPGLFGYDLEQDFRPMIQQLQSLGVKPALMGKLFRRHPQLLKIRNSFLLRTKFLISLGLEQTDLGKVIYNAPQLLGLSIDENMSPTVKFLQSIGIQGASLLKVLKLKPMILAYSVEGKLQLNIKFLGSIGIESSDVGKLITRHPQLLTLSVEKNLVPTVTYFLDLGFSREDVADMVRRLPSLLGFKVATVLDPKYRYFLNDMKRSRQELVRFPHYFSYSLSKRIVPRFERLKPGHLLSLNSIYTCSDAGFEQKLRRWKNNSS